MPVCFGAVLVSAHKWIAQIGLAQTVAGMRFFRLFATVAATAVSLAPATESFATVQVPSVTAQDVIGVASAATAQVFAGSVAVRFSCDAPTSPKILDPTDPSRITWNTRCTSPLRIYPGFATNCRGFSRKLPTAAKVKTGTEVSMTCTMVRGTSSKTATSSLVLTAEGPTPVVRDCGQYFVRSALFGATGRPGPFAARSGCDWWCCWRNAPSQAWLTTFER